MKRPFKIFFGVFAVLAVVGGVLKSLSRNLDRDIDWQSGDAARN